MGMLILIFGIGLMCASIATGIINYMEMAELMNNTEYSESKSTVHKLIIKLGVCVFGALSGFILFWYGLIIAII